MARPSKFTPEIGQSILRLAAAGVPKTSIGPRVGIGLRTLHDWLDRGRNGDPTFRDWAARVDAEVSRARRARHRVRAEADLASARARWQVFKAARERWWFDRLGPDEFWHRRMIWCASRGHHAAIARTHSPLDAGGFRTIETP